VKILLDECVPWPLAKYLDDHECSSVQLCGWAGIKNGELLRVAETRFELFITSDQSIEYQQNLTGRRIKIPLLSTNKFRQIVAGVSLMRDAVTGLLPREYRCLDLP
jgi:predicted nuclease of predicted toxin-antitoxin system